MKYEMVFKSRRCSDGRTPRSENGLRTTTEIRFCTRCRYTANVASLGFQPPMLPAADPIADQSAGALKVKVAGTAERLLLRPTPRRSARSARHRWTSTARASVSRLEA